MILTALDYRPGIIVLLPLIASCLIYVLGEHIRPNYREAITFAAAFPMAALVYSMIPAALAGKEIGFTLLEIVKGVPLQFSVDAAGMIFACVASTLWIVTSCYSIGYMRGHGEKNQTGYYSAFAMCLTATMGLCFSANLLTFFIFFEVLTVATYPLVVHYRDEEGTRSGRKYLAYTLISGQLFFAGIVILYSFTGRMDFVPGGFVNTGDIPMPWMLAVFILMSRKSQMPIPASGA